ncbi:XrtA system polysaccharide chain length determinant [Marinobacter zhejiangensis]|uniref:Polysaccharide chain length determinant protein, PEP-CTERM locus subfamily n=1 Tax=Marinobacter zhejiangensis TaxID=488535 RepID=A0A1I4RM69_9GAMM|nr:XrtA system polysaccharide chain length determinant [Marinobacter zhejiangensis]SFM53327.1 polysaccharide chain length determinant protein, PEP-CTERM locus subfamily [Marinobacter zhejiangensis]
MALSVPQLIEESIREIRTRKWLAFLLFSGVSLVVLVAALIWPYKYHSEVIIFVDDQNIIRPLMEGRAVTTVINERASSAEELLWSRKVMEAVATDENIFGNTVDELTPQQLEGRIGWLRASMSVKTRGDSYFSIGFTSTSPLRTFKVAQRLGQAFIEESNERKRAESRSAYDFIDRQVQSYERQLAETEAKLKEFLSENVEGTEGQANTRLAELRNQLELAQLARADLLARTQSLETELARVQPSIFQGRSIDSYEQRIRSLEEQLDNLRLQYHDTYPDIVILREQLAELKRQQNRALAQSQNSAPIVDGETIANPVYQQLRASLAQTRADSMTTETRIRSIERLLREQSGRMERIQANNAEYLELTRDLEVNRQIYDDLLKRRESARVSMHLDIEGQGLNFRINEAAQYPLNPTGVKFPMLAIAGLLLGVAAPFGAAVGFVQLDPRVRVRADVEEELELPVLEVLPEARTPFEKRKDRRRTIAVLICGAVVAAVYITVVITSILGDMV